MSRNKLRWSKEDIDFLKANYAAMPLEQMSRQLKRGKEGIKSAAALHGVTRPRRKGTLFAVTGKPRYRKLRNGCWQWTAATNAKGYPIARGTHTTLAHRQVYIDTNGPIPDEIEVDHLCRYRRCVNPEHLEAVTHQENIMRGRRAERRNNYMNTVVSFIVPNLTPPSTNHYKKPVTRRDKQGNPRLSFTLTPEAKAFRDAVAIFARGDSVTPDSERERKKCKYFVRVDVYLGPKQRLDADNAGKVALDALQNAGVLHSDAYVHECRLLVHKFQRDRPRTEFLVERL